MQNGRLGRPITDPGVPGKVSPRADRREDDSPELDAHHLREDELAQRWHVSRRTLQRWRSSGRAPSHLVLGQRILYRRQDVETFEARHLEVGEVD